MAIFLPQRWRTQPKYLCPPDFNNPLTRNLRGLWGIGASSFVDVLHGRVHSSESGTPMQSVIGKGTYYASGGDTRFTNIPDYNFTTGKFSIAVLFDIRTITNYSGLVFCQDSASTNGWELRLGASGATNANVSFSRCHGTGYTRFTESTSSISASTNRNFILVRASAADITTAPNILVNSTQCSTSQVAGTGTGAMTASTADLRFSERIDGVVYLDGNIYFVAIWNRDVGYDEGRAIWENPWQMFAPISHKKYFGSLVSGAYTLTSNTGSFTLSGQTANLLYGRSLVSSVGSFDLSGQSANLLYGRNLVGDVGTFTLSGNGAGLLRGYLVSSGTGSFVLTGNDATLTYSGSPQNYTLTAGTGSFSVNGQNANLLYGRTISVDAGSFSLTGQDAATLVGRKLVSDTGSFTLSGQDAGLKHAYILNCEKGTFTLSGKNAGLIYSGASGSTVEFFQGVSKPTPVTDGVSLNAHILTDAGGGTYTVDTIPSVSEDKTDSPIYEGYKIT